MSLEFSRDNQPLVWSHIFAAGLVRLPSVRLSLVKANINREGQQSFLIFGVKRVICIKPV